MQNFKRGLKGMLEFPCDVERLENGNTLITDAGDATNQGSEVIEVNMQGQIEWCYSDGLRFAHSAKRLNNGNTLISDTNNNRIIEVSKKGEVVFTTEEWGGGTGKLSDGSLLHYPNDAHQIKDERLLITDRNNDRCLIADKSGEIEWFYEDNLHHPHNCDLLDNGNILIADSGGNNIFEINQSKEIVWQYNKNNGEELSWPRDADPLQNGNLLITDSKNSRIIESNRKGEKIWEYKVDYFANFYEADMLENNNILISDQQHHRVFEVDKNGIIVWSFKNMRIPYKIHSKIQNGSLKNKDQKGMPAEWVLYNRFSEGGGQLKWETDDMKRDCPALVFDRQGILCLKQVVAVKPKKTYRMAGKLKTVNMGENSFAYLQIAFLDEYGGLIEDAAEAPKGNLFEEDRNWTEDSLEAVAPQNASAVELRVSICGEGKVLIKDIMFFG